jgi:hypothetical protein
MGEEKKELMTLRDEREQTVERTEQKSEREKRVSLPSFYLFPSPPLSLPLSSPSLLLFLSVSYPLPSFYDSLKSGPICLGDATEADWLDKVQPVIQQRIEK